jgi:hypothetical protein
MKSMLTMLGSVLLLYSDNAVGQTLPKLLGASLRAQVVHESQGFFRYQYRLSVSPTEPLTVDSWTLDVATDQSRSAVALDGLPAASPRVVKVQANRAPATAAAVGHAITGVPEEWSAGIDGDVRALFGAKIDATSIHPGAQRDGFEVSSAALPGIRDARVRPDLWQFLPDIDADPAGEELYDQVPSSSQIIKTVGPVAPPANFSPRAFADEIEVMVNEARAQGWIATDEAKLPLTDSLAALKTALDASDFNDARSAASGFIAQVNLTGCGVFNCGGSQQISSEAYALLRMNMEYLRDRIPTTIRTTVIESDEDMDSFIVDEIIRAEGSIGDQDGTAAELSLVQDLAGPQQSAQFAYPSNVVVPFVFSFDGRAATIDVGGGGRSLRTESLIFPLTVAPENLFVRAGASAADATISITNLVLDGQPIPQTVVASSAGGGLGILRIEASDLDDGFTLAGNVAMSWTGVEPVGSELSVQLRAADVVDGPD